MQDTYIDINGIPTHIMTWGQRIDGSFNNVDNTNVNKVKRVKKEIIIMIPGNPGILGFYESFCTMVHDYIERAIPIWIIGNYKVPTKKGKRKGKSFILIAYMR